MNDGESLFDSEWVQLADYLQVQWKGTLKALIRISSRVDDGEIDSLASPKKTISQESWASSFIDVDEVISETQSWLNTTIDAFETENSNIIEQVWLYPASIYLFKVNYINTRKRCEIFDVSDVVLVFLLLTLKIFHTFFLVFLLLTLNG